MPTFPAGLTLTTTTGQTVSMVDITGRKYSSFFRVDVDATGAQILALSDAIGNASNAAVYSTATAIERYTTPTNPAIVVFDEAFSSGSTVAVFKFQNDAFVTTKIEVPAADAQMFVPASPETIDPTNARAAAVITAALAALNAGTPAGTFAFVGGFLSGRSRRARFLPIRPEVGEPAVGDLPGDLPAIGP